MFLEPYLLSYFTNLAYISLLCSFQFNIKAKPTFNFGIYNFCKFNLIDLTAVNIYLVIKNNHNNLILGIRYAMYFSPGFH